MVQLVPVPFDVLITRMFRELERKKSIFDLPAQRFVQAHPGFDLSLDVFGRRASTPFGPAAGPHTQMAQNIALSWLAGGRVIECKTVQIKDDIEVPRPCIDMATVGFNVEWSQELKVEESLEEYVKGAMLIEMLKASGLGKGLDDVVFDMSVGYDLAGIRSAKVRGFLDGMLDASAVVERLRRQIPASFVHLRDLPFPTRISDTLTLSTFHGCPPGEVEGIVEYLIEEVGLEVVVKLNPTLLGRARLDDILHGRLGYVDLCVPDKAFEEDATWRQATEMVDRLGNFAKARGKGLGVKFSNTLIVENYKSFFSASEKFMYLSGAPLHPLAISLVAKFREAFGDRFPVSFSGGVDAANFSDTVGLGLKPVTVCSDFLGPSGYRRGWAYVSDLVKRMKAAGVSDLDAFTLKAHGQAEAALADVAMPDEARAACRAALGGSGDLRAAAGDAFAAWVSAARVRNSTVYAEKVLTNARYTAAANSKPPRKVGSSLALFDCLTCDKCIPLCPNDAIFSFVIPPGETLIERVSRDGDGWSVETVGALKIAMKTQIGAYADACNECGNCDVLCPEDGGPYKTKPLFFGARSAFEATADRDGFFVESAALIYGRIQGEVVTVEKLGGHVRYAGAGFDLTLDPADVAGSVSGAAQAPVDLKPMRILLPILDGVVAADAVNYVSAGLEGA